MIYKDLKIITDQLTETHTFVYFDNEGANIEADDVPEGQFYIVLDYPPRLSTKFNKAGTFDEIITFRLFVLNNKSINLDYGTELDDNSDQRDAIQNECKAVLKRFLLLAIRKFPYIKQSKDSILQVNCESEAVQYLFNGNYHGVESLISLPVVLPTNYCLSGETC